MTFKSLIEQLNHKLNTLKGDVGLYVKFLGTQKTFEYNSGQQFWAASTIKIPIALAFYKKATETNLDINSRIQINNENFVLGSGITKLLDKSNQYTYKDLITLMLTVSDNSATNELIDYCKINFIEEYIQDLGLKNTTFRHKMMISGGNGPNLTTAKEMGILLEKMYKNEVVGGTEVLEIMTEQLDRSRIPLLIPNDVKISYKNGSLKEAMHEVGIVYAGDKSKNADADDFIFCFYSDDQKDKRKTNQVLSDCAKLCFDYSKIL